MTRQDEAPDDKEDPVVTAQDMTTWVGSPGVVVDGSWCPILPCQSKEAARTFAPETRWGQGREGKPFLAMRNALVGFRAPAAQAARLKEVR